MFIEFKLIQYNFYFLDINECLSNPCDLNATCLNTDGIFKCTCNIGYSGNGFNCNGKCVQYILEILMILWV